MRSGPRITRATSRFRSIRRLLFAAVGAATAGGSAHAADVISTWNGGSSAWEDASNWTNIPAVGYFPSNGGGGYTFDAVIGLPGTCTLSSNVGVQSLTINSATARLSQSAGTLTLNANSAISLGTYQLAGGTLAGAGALQVGGTLAWSGGTMAGTGQTTIGPAGHAVLSGDPMFTTLARTLVNEGTLDCSGGVTLLDGTISNSSTGLFRILTPTSLRADMGTNAFNNAGTLDQNNSAATSIYIPLNNSGTVHIRSGSMNVGLGSNSGTFTVDAGASLVLNDGYVGFTHAASALINGGGSVQFNGTHDFSGTLAVNGSLTFNGYITVRADQTLTCPVTLQSGELGGGGNITLTNLTWTDGTASGPGKLIIAPTGTLTVAGYSKTLSRTLENQGTTNSNAAMWFAGGTFTNKAGAVFNLGSGGRLSYQSGSNLFENAGVFHKTSSDAAFIPIPFNNSGTVSLHGGKVEFDSGGINTGTISVENNAVVAFGGSYTHAAGGWLGGPGVFQFNTGSHDILSTFAPTGPVSLFGGAVTVRNSFTPSTLQIYSSLAVEANQSWAYLDLYDGTVQGSGEITLGRGFNWSGGSLLAGGKISLLDDCSFAIRNDTQHDLTLARTLSNFGEISYTGSHLRFVGGTLANGAGGTMTLSSAAMLEDGGGSNLLSNAALLNKTTSSIASIRVPLNNTGTLNVSAGELELGGGGASTGTFDVQAGATLTIAAPQSFTHGPGSRITGAGRLSLNQGSQNFSGRIETTGPIDITTAVYFNGDQDLHGPVTFSDGVIGSWGTATLHQSLEWSGGTMSGAGLTRVPSGSTLQIVGANFKGLSRILENSGVAEYNGDSLSMFFGTINNLPGGTFTLKGSSRIYDAGGTNAFNNSGVFSKSGSGNAIFDVPFTNSGSVTVGQGTLTLAKGCASISGGNLATGTWNVYAGAAINITGGTAITVNAASVLLDGAGASLTGIDSLVDNRGVFKLSNGRNFSAPGQFNNSGVLSAGPGSTFTVGGRLNWSAGSIAGDGIIDARNGVNISGAVLKAGPGTLTIDGPQDHSAGARLTINSGTVALLSNAGAPAGTGSAVAHLEVQVYGGTLQLDAEQDLASLNVDEMVASAVINFLTDSAHGLRIYPGGTSSGATVSGAVLDALWQDIRAGNLGPTAPGIRAATISDPAMNGLGLVLATDAAGAQYVSLREMILGDVNGDDKVTIGDVMIALNSDNYQQDGTWLNGDVNYDGKVTIGDVMLMLNSDRYQQTYDPANAPAQAAALRAAGLGSLADAAVPEPAALALVAIGAAGALLRRRR